MYKAPLVARFTFGTEDEAFRAYEQLESMGLFGDMVESTEPGRTGWKVLFMDPAIAAIRLAMKRTKPRSAEVFDVSDPSWNESAAWKPFN